jgi:phosphoribosylglycinamide formyltransferase-1
MFWANSPKAARGLLSGKLDMKNIVALVSGNGTNLQALIDAERRGVIKGGRITAVLSSKADAYALERARSRGIPARAIPRGDYPDDASYGAAIKEALDGLNADLAVCAGFMNILDAAVCDAYRHRIINVHPSLLPAFCGKGLYGLRVHEEALKRGVKVTGATVHFVTEVCDGGPIILQKAVPVLDGDTPPSLQRRVMEECEYLLLPEAVSLFCEDKLTVTDGRVVIR